MELFTLSNKFGGLNSTTAPHLIGPNRAQALSSCELASGSIKAEMGLGFPVFTSTDQINSCYKFNGTWVDDRNIVNWQYVEFDTRLVRVAAGETPQISADAVTWFDLGIAAPVAAMTVGDGGGGGALSAGTYNYFYTYVSVLGGESAPSPISADLTLVISHKGALTVIAASADPQVVSKNIYRTGGTISSTNLIGNIPNATVILTDNIADLAVGVAMSSQGYGVPGMLEWIATSAYGVLFAGIGPDVFFSEPGFLQAWPAANEAQFPENTVAGVEYGGSMVVVTDRKPYEILGNTPENFSVVAIDFQGGCLARDTLVNMGTDGVFYLTQNGLVSLGMYRQVTNISKDYLNDAMVATPGCLELTTLRATRYGDRYLLFVNVGTSFPTGGWIEWNKHVDGNWLVTNQGAVAGGLHYNRTDDLLYCGETVAQTVSQFEDVGEAITILGSYRTGSWIEDGFTALKHWKQCAIDHSGAITATVTIDGVAVVTALALTQGSNIGRSRFRLPPGCRGRAFDVQLNWDSGYNGTIAEILTNIARKSEQL